MSGNSPTSSRNSVPPSARANTPSREDTASVNAPRSWPKNSLPDNSGTMVLQSRITRSPLLARESRAWMRFANNSLPVPLSPSISIEVSVKLATSTTCRRIAFKAWLSPTRTSCTAGEFTIPSTVFQRWRRAVISWTAMSDSVHTNTSEAPASISRHAASPGIAAQQPANTCTWPLRLRSRSCRHISGVTSLQKITPGPQERYAS